MHRSLETLWHAAVCMLIYCLMCVFENQSNGREIFWYFVIVTVKGSGAHHDIPSVLKVHPDQASGLQDADGVNHSHLAANNLGSGSGWQQSKQNWIPLAVMGECA